MKNKILLILSAFVLTLPLVACNSQTVTMSPSEKQVAQERRVIIAEKSRKEGYKAVKAILDVYVSHLPGKLESLVSENFVPSKDAFINHVERATLERTMKNIEIIVDHAVFEGNTFSVSYHWTRTYMIRGNAYYSRDSGATNFVFVKEVGGWRLQEVRGADIF